VGEALGNNEALFEILKKYDMEFVEELEIRLKRDENYKNFVNNEDFN
jgi:hypothetical protein